MLLFLHEDLPEDAGTLDPEKLSIPPPEIVYWFTNRLQSKVLDLI